MHKAWFDARACELLTDPDLAAERAREAGTAVMPLIELLETPDFPYKDGDFPRVNGSGWTRDQLIGYGQHMLGLLTEQPDSTPPIRREHFRRLVILGVGPSIGRISFADFKDAIGATPKGARPAANRLAFRNADLDVFRSTGMALVKKLGRKLTNETYRAAIARNEVPSYERLQQIVGNVGELNDLLGYPNFEAWEAEDYVDYGLRYLHANTPEKFTVRGLTVVSRRDYGPWPKTANKFFHSWSGYKGAVMDEWARLESARNTRLTSYRTSIEAGALPAEFSTLDNAGLLQAGGRYRLIAKCDPSMKPDTVMRYTTFSPAVLATKMRERQQHISKAYIESVAQSMHILDDTYPEPHDPRIIVTDEDIMALRLERNAQDRKRRAAANTRSANSTVYEVTLSATVSPP